MRILFAFLACIASLAPSLLAQATDRFAPIRGAMRRFLDSTGTASVAVAIAKDGKIIWEEATGWANREKMIPATVNTMYSQASISKPVTATGIMVLVERGKVDLDRPANDYLGAGKLTGLAGDASGATVKRVLSHTAGLPLHYQFFYADRGYSPPTMDETIARYGNLVFAPGRIFEYSNLGFGIIDYIIERVSGQPYPDFMRNEVFLPLGLTRTAVGIPAGMEAFAAERYDRNQRPISFYVFDHNGASAVYSSAHDLIRFGMFHLKNRLAEQRAILKDATLDLMHTAVAPATYGLGWAVSEDDNGYRRYAHTGGMPGVATVLHIFPTANLAVVVLANASQRPEPVAREIETLMLPGWGDSLKARQARPRTPPTSSVTELAGEWSGTLRTWQRTVPMRLLVKPDGDIHVWIAEQQRAIVNNPNFANGRLSGRFAGQIPTDDAGRWRHDLVLGLLLEGNTLRGQVNALTFSDPSYYALASYAELTKK